MGERMNVDGWLVAETELVRGFHPYTSTDKVFIFRDPAAGWSLLTIERQERWDDQARPITGRALVALERFAALDDLAAYIDDTYRTGAWLEILDAGHDHDPDLYAAWVPERMARDLDRASVHNQDLAHTPGHFDSGPLSAPGRALQVSPRSVEA